MVLELKNPKNKLYYTILAIPILLFGIYISIHALDMPYADDMELVKTINDSRENPSEIFSILVRQQNDHRIAFSRLGILISYFLTGKIDFRATILLGYFNLVFLCFGFFLIFRYLNRPILLFMPVVLILFSPIVYQAHFWSITAFQYTLSIAFSIVSLFYLRPGNQKKWPLSLVFAVFATLSNLDGLSVIPIAIFWLACQRRWKETVIYFCFSIAYLLFFFNGFQFSSVSHIDYSFHSIGEIGASFLVITGSFAKIVSDTYGVSLSKVLGAVILLTFVSIKFWSYSKNKNARFSNFFFSFDFVEICFLRLLASMVMIAIGRHWDGIDNMMAARFSVYSVSMIAAVYLVILGVLRKEYSRIFQVFSILTGVILCSFGYLKYDADTKYLTSKLKADSFNYAKNGVYFYQYLNLSDPPRDFYRHYKYPAHLKPLIVEAWTKEGSFEKQDAVASVTISQVSNTGQYGAFITPVIEFNVEIDHLKPTAEDFYLSICLNDTTEKLYFIALRERNAQWMRQVFVQRKHRKFFSAIPKKIASGTYTARLCWMEQQKPVSMPISNRLIVN